MKIAFRPSVIVNSLPYAALAAAFITLIAAGCGGRQTESEALAALAVTPAVAAPAAEPPKPSLPAELTRPRWTDVQCDKNEDLLFAAGNGKSPEAAEAAARAQLAECATAHIRREYKWSAERVATASSIGPAAAATAKIVGQHELKCLGGKWYFALASLPLNAVEVNVKPLADPPASAASRLTRRRAAATPRVQPVPSTATLDRLVEKLDRIANQLDAATKPAEEAAPQPSAPTVQQPPAATPPRAPAQKKSARVLWFEAEEAFREALAKERAAREAELAERRRPSEFRPAPPPPPNSNARRSTL